MEEVLPFLDNERLDVREEAARILSLHSLQEFEFLSKHTDLFTLKLNEEESVSKHILDCLINTSSLIEINSPVLVKKTIDIIKTNSVLAESCCLLINNLNVEIEFLDDLIDILNYNCDKYHHLSGVFTKLSSTNQGSLYLLDRMDRILIYSTHDNFIRRRNSISVLKNICLQNHEPSTLTNLLPFILDPLMGPEEYDLDEMELFPSQLQFLESTKRREPDETLRLMLVESLLLISSFGVKGRDLLRKNGVYFIIRTMHLTEECENVREMIERVVDLLQRDEPREPIREIINGEEIDR